MLIKVDATQLEWRTKVFLSQDPVAMKEINEGYPIHDDNRERFGLPTRTIAKIFLYRAIFADCFGEQGFKAPAFAYANDSDFLETSKSSKFWESVLENFFKKYAGVYDHSLGLIRQAINTGRITSPSGRFYHYSSIKKRNGSSDWPRAQILNHVVQGLAADFVMLARKLLRQRLGQLEGYHLGFVLPINTVHDSIELDVDNYQGLCYNVSKLLESCFSDIPKEFEKNYGIKVNVPMAGEVKLGWTLHEPDMIKFNPKTFEEDWKNLYV